jgi:ABC-type nitrate/sulfonate/bicarbonate transport system ATPase subunit
MSIEISSVSFGYDRTRTVLNAVSLEVPKGDLVAVLGPSGCGKSTLLRLVAGIIPNHQAGNWMTGTIITNTSPLNGSNPRPGELSLMFQEPVLLPNRTVEENLALPLQMLRFPRPVISERVDGILDQIGLKAFRNLRPTQLSVGMKTRVSLGMTFVPRPSILLLDEPFSSLDIAWRLALYRALSDFRKAEMSTALLVTHDLREAILLADAIFVLRSDGRMLEPFRIDLSKPVNFTVEELEQYNKLSINEYSLLERSLLASTTLSEGTQGHK